MQNIEEQSKMVSTKLSAIETRLEIIHNKLEQFNLPQKANEVKVQDRKMNIKDMLVFFEKESPSTIYNWKNQAILPDFHYDPSGHPYLLLSECEAVREKRAGRRRFKK